MTVDRKVTVTNSHDCNRRIPTQHATLEPIYLLKGESAEVFASHLLTVERSWVDIDRITVQDGDGEPMLLSSWLAQFVIL